MFDSSRKLHPFETRLLSYFRSCLDLDPDNVPEIGVSIPLPTFSSDECLAICESVKPVLLQQASVIQLMPPIYVVGDLHGNIYDLIRILVMTEGAPKNKFLFLGDYVDRGPYSVEVTMLLFILVIIYPQNVFLIRGNHEFRNINELYGFKDQVIKCYGLEEVYEAFNKAFDCLPFAATIGDCYFAVHGGISPNLTDISQIADVKRPLVTCDIPVIRDIVWSDPDKKIEMFKESSRGDGFLFGEKALTKFLESFGFQKILRAHQCVRLGIDKFFNEKGYTIFSSSAYDIESNNRCGLMYIGIDNSIQTFSMPPITPISRENALLAKGSDLLKKGVTVSSSQMTLPKCQIIKQIPTNLSNTRKRKRMSANFCSRSMSAAASLLTIPFVTEMSPFKLSKLTKSTSMSFPPYLE